MSYLVLARKYRPQEFDQVVQQDHITRTLKNAIASDRVAHAILLTGPRGTGKTTVARILAKAMNCKEGPIPVPCNACRSCKEITGGNAVDVIEIDGASNNSVDQVRDLRENLKYMPAHSRSKIYIIDEVHMLTQAAFNALLKTLEEPPSHVMFIFATTEPHKIPITILSRCQRHDFRRIDLESIANHMAKLCAQEGFEITDESLDLIAREAEGCMRDALSLLDQVITCSDGSIKHEQILDILGVIDRKILFEISEAVLQKDIRKVLEKIDQVYNRGHDMKKFFADLVEHFRNLLVVKMSRNAQNLVDLPAHEIDQMARQVEAMSTTWLNQIFDLLFREEATVRLAPVPRLALETAFFRIFQIQPALSIDVLIERLEKLQRRITPGGQGGLSESQAAFGDLEDTLNITSSKVQDDRNAVAKAQTSTPEKAETAPPEEDKGDADKADLDGFWEKILKRIAQQYPSLAANLNNSTLKKKDGNNLQIEVNGNGFNISMVKRPRNLAKIGEICRDVFGMEVKIKVIAKKQKKPKKKEHENRLKQEALSHPLVSDAVEIFDGTLLDVKGTEKD